MLNSAEEQLPREALEEPLALVFLGLEVFTSPVWLDTLKGR